MKLTIIVEVNKETVELFGTLYVKEQLREFIEGDEGQNFLELLKEQYYQREDDEDDGDGEEQDDDEDED